jgi:hypothetical protein
MPRPRQRVCLQDGLKLDLNRLIRKGVARLGARTSARVTWTHAYWGEIASATINAHLAADGFGSLRVELDGDAPQFIQLATERRRLGGRQWYFVCSRTGRRASVLWRPPGATRFYCRQAWGSRVAYQSQFLDRDNRAHLGQSKIKNRLIRDLDPDDWDLPPKPKWMRWRTYQRYADRFDRHEATLDYGIAALASKFMGRGW